MKVQTKSSASGFSLIELTIAMLVTLIVSGAIFGLLSGGKSAFRREPELSERQQNIRVAMDLIQKDIGNAGMEMSDFVQAFTRGDGPTGTPAPALNGLGPMGPNGVNSDFLQLFGNTGECPSAQAESNVTGVVVRMIEIFPNCFRLPALVMLVGDPTAPPPGYGVGFACPRGTGAGNCGAVACANFPPGQSQYNLPGGDGIPEPLATMLPVQVVRYEIRTDADGLPNLWRSPEGDTFAINQGNACGGGQAGGEDPWQLVARGIEDMQIRYTMARLDASGNPVVLDTPDEVLAGNYGTLVKEVRVSLTARSDAANLQGAQTGTNPGGVKVRGSMVSVTTPRAALFALSKAATPLWR